MNAGESLPVGQHDVEIQANRTAWERKAQLRAVYKGFHELIASRIDRSIGDNRGARIRYGLHQGSDPGLRHDRSFANPWLDRQENAYQLHFSNGSVSNLILFDVWHHLRYPGTALDEFRRVLAPGGRVIVFDPAISVTGRLIYGLCHHEPVGMGLALTWDAPSRFKPADSDYFAAQGSATRIFWRKQNTARLANWDLTEVTPLPSFEYFATGGFSGPQLGGPTMFRFWRFLDRTLARWPHLFAARLLVVLKKPLQS